MIPSRFRIGTATHTVRKMTGVRTMPAPGAEPDRHQHVIVEQITPRGPAQARALFGGLDAPAIFVGLLVATAMELLLVIALGSAFIRSVGVSSLTADGATLGALAAAVVIMFLAYLVGGWAAARMARFDGVRNGIAVAVAGVLLAALVGVAGAAAGQSWNLPGELGFERVLTTGEFGASAAAAGVLAAVGKIAAGALGGMIGDRYNRRVDTTLGADTAGPSA